MPTFQVSTKRSRLHDQWIGNSRVLTLCDSTWKLLDWAMWMHGRILETKKGNAAGHEGTRLVCFGGVVLGFSQRLKRRQPSDGRQRKVSALLRRAREGPGGTHATGRQSDRATGS